MISRPKLSPGSVDLSIEKHGSSKKESNMSKDEYVKAIQKAKEHILAGDIFQIVLSQRFERRTYADPFEVYRALRIVNPSPYMIYLQVCILFLMFLSLVFLHSRLMLLGISVISGSWMHYGCIQSRDSH